MAECRPSCSETQLVRRLEALGQDPLLPGYLAQEVDELVILAKSISARHEHELTSLSW